MEQSGHAPATDNQSGLADVVRVGMRREVVLQVPPDHQLHELPRRRRHHIMRAHFPAVLENRHALRDLEDLAKAVGDVQDRHAAFTEQADTFEERRDLVW